MDPQDVVREACPTIGLAGWSFYFAPATVQRAAGLGLDAVQFYVLGRGGVLGDVEADVVSSAFGYFNPSLIEAMWCAGKERIAPRDAGRAFLAAAHDHGRARLSDVQGVEGFVRGAEVIVDAARRHASGLVLFAAAAAEPLPDDLPARAMHLLAVLRELRGSARLVCVVAAGLDPVTAHYMRSPGAFATFGWTDADVPTVTDADVTADQLAERMTDRLVARDFAALDETMATPFLDGVMACAAALSATGT